MELGARSQEPGARSQEPGARSQEPGARSQELGARSQELGARSQELGARSFSKPFNLKRHVNNFHGVYQERLPRKVPSFAIGSTVMQHPFTCIIAGCTQSGKTVWVKKLLENAKTTISPPPERIIWCYGQWQPILLDFVLLMNDFIVAVLKK